MKITVNDPMAALRQAKAETVNRGFNLAASENLHRDLAHAHKRAMAAEVVAGRPPAAEFQAEAELRGITARQLALLILEKPNHVAARELQRQQILQRIAAAASPAELDQMGAA